MGILYRGTSWVLESDYPLGQKLEMAGGVWQREEEGGVRGRKCLL